MTTLEFSAMVQKYQSLVYTVCHQLVPDAGDAQDLTQETFLAAWRAIDRCPSGFEKQWLARIAANKAKDYLRSAWVRRVNIPGDDVLALLLNKFTKLTLSKSYFMTDAIVLALSLTYIPAGRIVFSFITVTLSSFLIERIQRIGAPCAAAEQGA